MTAFDDLVALMVRLRGPGGCPWDREQTLETLKTYLLEETYEVLDALDGGDPGEHREELGDLLFQVIFQSQLRSEEGAFTIEEVIEGIHDKLVRRHPHVFGDSAAGTSREVLDQWERLKAEEKRGTSRPSLLDHVPEHLPALLKTLRLTEKAARVGFDWTEEQDLLEKGEEEWRELREAVADGRKERIAEELGDLLFVLANLARRQGLDPEDALRQANRKFQRRFRYIEESLGRQGLRPQDVSLQEMDALWDEAKAGGDTGE
jgi:tetrapyrrole methylase family protein/MazG family protein